MLSILQKNCLLAITVIFYIFSCTIFASDKNLISSIELNNLIEQAKDKNLGKSKQWLRLLHYNQGGTLHSRNRSYVTSPSFFLSKDGKINPEQELIENIRQFFGSNIQQRCIFPARFHWLSEQLKLENYILGLSHCSTFLKVQKELSAKKMTLIFPSAYLNSASSILGHTLLRIDTSDDDAVILNWAINYGAKLDENDGAIKYALKGITGLYEGQYFIVPYSQKIKEYGQMENRDIWEYPLNLNEEEVTFLSEHLWELKDINFDYFFFDENCSYRLLELLEVAKPELDLTNHFQLTEIPINTVKVFNDNNLIETTNFRPSKERILNQQFENLSPSERSLSKRISGNHSAINEKEFKSLNTEQQLKILQSSYDYLRFQQSQERRDNEIAKRSLSILKSINDISIKQQNNYKINNNRLLVKN